MADSGVIKEFLVGLGFDIKDASWKKFQDGVKRADKSVGGLGASVEKAHKGVRGFQSSMAEFAEAAGIVAFVAAIEKTADVLDGLYWQSIRTNSSVANIKAFGYGLSQVGGSADGANAALENLSTLMKSNPGIERFISGNLGVRTRSANGDLRDRVEILEDLGTRLRAMPEYLAIRYAQMLGIGDIRTLEALMRNSDRFKDHQREFARSIGLNMTEAADAANEFKTAEREMFNDLEMLTLKVGGDFIKWVDDGVRKVPRLGADMSALGGATQELFSTLGELFGLKDMPFFEWLDARVQELTHLIRALDYAIKAIQSPLGSQRQRNWFSAAGYEEHIAENIDRTPLIRGSAPSAGNISGRGTDYVAAWFTSHGVSVAAAHGIAAAMVGGEGGTSANAWNPQSAGRSHAYGRGQWLGAGQKEYSDWARSIGLSNTSMRGSTDDEQFAFMMYQWTRGSEQKAGRRILGAGSDIEASHAYLGDYMRPGRGLGGDIRRSDQALATINQKTDIHVHGSGDAMTAAKATTDAQRRVNADLVRNTAGAIQ